MSGCSTVFTLLGPARIAAAFISKRVLACALVHLVWTLKRRQVRTYPTEIEKAQTPNLDAGQILIIHTVLPKISQTEIYC